jgi:Na+-transporting NADH:ubiquinone oxidoreductase subunit NqrF
LIPRLSKEKINPARWDEMWVESTLRKYNAPDVKRMWVCGPPMMNELFDRTLMDMRTRTPAYMMIDPYHVELL